MSALPQAWHWSPAPGFDFVGVVSADETRVFQFAMRDCFNEALSQAVLEFAYLNSAKLADNSKPIVGLPGFSCPSYDFDALGAVPPSRDRVYSGVSDFDRIVVPVFPAYHFEFRGNETAEEAGIRFGRMLRTAEVERDPSPFLRMRYKNLRTGSRTPGEGYQLLPAPYVHVELANLIDSPGSFVEIENWQGRNLRAEWSDLFMITEGSSVTQMDLARASAAIDALLTTA